jgi:hypothetical protein
MGHEMGGQLLIAKKQLWPMLMYYSNIHLHRLIKTKKKLKAQETKIKQGAS